MPKNGKTREEFFSEWRKKGIEWLLERLWNSRKETKKARELAVEYYKAERAAIAKNQELYLLKRENSAMAEVIRSHGIFPTRLRVTFVDVDCKNCPRYSEDPEEFDCFGCGEKIGDEEYRETEATFVESISFYTYRIKGHEMTGINATFEDSEYDVIKVVDESTGDVLFQREEREGGEHESSTPSPAPDGH